MFSINNSFSMENVEKELKISTIDGGKALIVNRKNKKIQETSALMTADVDYIVTDNNRQCLESGIEYYINKPIHIQMLYEIVKGWIREDVTANSLLEE